MKKLVDSIVPKYAIFPLILAVVVNMLVYTGSKIFTNSLVHYDLSMEIDNNIPFVSVFIIIYVLCFAEWVIGYILIARESKEYCYYYVSADIIAKLICLLFFIFLPTTFNRPEVVGNGILDNLTRFIYWTDKPVNLFPSIHCLESWMVFRGSIKMKKMPKFYKIFTFVYAILVCMSVVFVKQHVFIDIIGGILVLEIGLYLAKKFDTKNIFMRLEKRFSK